MAKSPLKIQLAIQGGGAKLHVLLAALEAVRELEREEKLQVTRLAGTSAGAIAACLYATKIPIVRFREKIFANKDHLRKKVFPPLWKSTIYKRFLRGEPIYKTNSLRQFLKTLFEEHQGQPKYETLGQLNANVPVFITVSDMLNGEQKNYDSNKDGQQRIADALIESCALPFVFVASKNIGTSPKVDGGLCENLPVDALLAKEDDLGRVVGISFEKEPFEEPDDLKKFSLSLMLTAINNSVARAKKILGNHSVLEIKTSIGTLDFEKVLNAPLDDDHFYRIKADARDWFRNNVLKDPENIGQVAVTDDPWQNPDPITSEMMKDLWRVYQAQHEPQTVVYEKLAMLVTANSIQDENNVLHGLDQVKRILTINSLDGPIYVRSMNLSSQTGTFEGKASWRVLDSANNTRGVIVIPIHKARGQSQVLLFFNPPLKKEESGPFRIIQQDAVRNGMAKLRALGEDRLSETIEGRNPIGKIDLVLYVPENAPEVFMESFKPENLAYQTGRKMKDNELNAYGPPPSGFRAMGWTGSNVQPKHIFGANFEVPEWRRASG